VALPLAPNELHLWLARPERAGDPAVLDACLALLAPDERERHRRFVFEPRRREYAVTRALVRTVLSRYGPLSPDAWRFVRNAHGRPELDPPIGLSFNVSNSAGLVACAVARQAVGIDLEAGGRGETLLGLAETVFSPAERRALEELPPPQRADRALSLWTLKEAYLKARGAGLSLPLQELTFAVGASVTASFGPAIGDHPARWVFRLLDHAGHRLALATEGPLHLRAWEIVPCSPAPALQVAGDAGP
jgi:4'-phosphopantetheinyl transferase